MEIETFKQKLESSLEFFKEDIKSIRTGRATPALVEDTKVNYYNVPTPLKQLASINTPEPRLIVISPYDKSTLADIEKAIDESDLGLTGTNDGTVLRINIPLLTEERREELVRTIHQKAEEVKVGMRNSRREAIEELEKKEKAGKISEDDRFKGEKLIQEILDDYMKKIDEAVGAKEKEIREI